jgi:GNAT superfamily N-acetyltransferase
VSSDPTLADQDGPTEALDWRRGPYTISTDPDRIDLEAVHRFLADSYWAADRPPDVIDRSLQRSLTFGLFHGETQIGMARVVSDFATFAWLCDVYIEPAHRGSGLGRWLVEVVSGHPDLRGVGRWLLATSHSHSLYAGFGFTELPEPDRYMIRRSSS